MIKYSIRGENLEVTEAIRDYVVSKLEKIEKYFQADQELDARVNLKVKKKNRIKSDAGKLFTDAVVEEATTTEKVVRSKTIDLEPMDLDEAILQMDLLAHDFFIYRDAEDNTTNVIYRREDGDIGLLEVKE